VANVPSALGAFMQHVDRETGTPIGSLMGSGPLSASSRCRLGGAAILGGINSIFSRILGRIRSTFGAETVAQEQYFISSGVRRSLASHMNAVNQIPATIVRSGQADVQTTLRLNQLFSPKFEVPANSRLFDIQPPIRVPIEVQPLGIPGQPASIPLNQVKIVPP